MTRIDILSDGDADGNGELDFKVGICPAYNMIYTRNDADGELNWTEGPHPTHVELKSESGNTPDQVRIVPWMYEDDAMSGSQGPNFQCDFQQVAEPGRDDEGEWNFTPPIDIDLTKYPGAKAGGSFVRRSKPLAGGSTVSFDVRGWFLVERY
jgi:hypothetical protein